MHVVRAILICSAAAAMAWPQDEPRTLPIERWSRGIPGCDFRAAGGAQLETVTVKNVEWSVAFAEGKAQYWLYISAKNRGAEPVEIRPELLQLLSVQPYERQMLYRSAEGVIALARRLGGGDAVYRGPPVSVKRPPASAALPQGSDETPYASADYEAMDRAYHLAETDPSDAGEIACHIEERMLRAITVAPGQRRAGFVLFEAPPPRTWTTGNLLIQRVVTEIRWTPSAFLLTIPTDAGYVQFPFGTAR